MNRLKILGLGMASVVLAASLAAGVSYALFSARTDNQINTMTAGTLSISNADKTTWDVNVGNMAPGDTFEKIITVTNTGSLALEFAGTNSRSGALFAGPARATVDLLNAYGTLAPGASQDVTVRVSLPLAANNTYQTATGHVVVTFNAFQTRNLTAGAATAVQTNDNAYNAALNAFYDGYLFQDGGGNTIPMTDANLLGLYEIRPDGTSNYLSADGSNDPKLWFNNAKPDGIYNYVIVTKSGFRYTASINHVSN